MADGRGPSFISVGTTPLRTRIFLGKQKRATKSAALFSRLADYYD
jgi:hypothetical protein